MTDFFVLKLTSTERSFKKSWQEIATCFTLEIFSNEPIKSCSASLIFTFKSPADSIWFSSIKPSIITALTSVPLLVKMVGDLIFLSIINKYFAIPIQYGQVERLDIVQMIKNILTAW